VLIEVTDKHIKNGKPLVADCCPIALALKDSGWTHARVLNSEVIVDDIWFTLPRSAKRFVSSVDSGRPVKPFRFRLDTL
jgi:hypothetical protein